MELNKIIHVDFKVWQELQVRRETEATTENDVLRGLLNLSELPEGATLTVASNTGQPLGTDNPRKKLKVTFADGEVIRDNQVARTFVRTIDKIGPDRVFGLHIDMAGNPLVAERPGNRRVQWKPLSDGRYVNTGSSTDTKREQLERIRAELRGNFRVELV